MQEPRGFAYRYADAIEGLIDAALSITAALFGRKVDILSPSIRFTIIMNFKTNGGEQYW